MGRPSSTHCQHGHELTGDNVYLSKNGKYTNRKCRACTLARMKDWRATPEGRAVVSGRNKRYYEQITGKNRQP